MKKILIRHIGIVTQDLEREKTFYKNMGLVCIYDATEHVRIVKLKDDGGHILELLQYESQSENTLRQKGISHVAFTEDPEGNYLELVEEEKNALGQ